MSARSKLRREWVVSELDEWGDIVDHSMHETEAAARREYAMREAAGERVTMERWDTYWTDSDMDRRDFYPVDTSKAASEAEAAGKAAAAAEVGQS